MKKFLFLIFFFLPTLHSNAQSIFLDSLQNVFSGTVAYGRNADVNSYAFGASYTINGAVNAGIFYLAANQDIYEGGGFEFKGSGVGGYVSFAILNELRESPVGLELGFLFESIKFKQERSDSDGIKNRSFGVGLNFSKRTILDNGDPGFLVAQAGITAFPISETVSEVEAFNGTTIDPFFAGNLASAFLIGNSSDFKLVLEPGVSYNFKHEIAAFSFSITAIF